MRHDYLATPMLGPPQKTKKMIKNAVHNMNALPNLAVISSVGLKRENCFVQESK